MSQPDNQTEDGLTEAQREAFERLSTDEAAAVLDLIDDRVAAAVDDRLNDSAPITRRDALKGGAIAAALGLGGGAGAGTVAADTGDSGGDALSIASATANTYRITDNRYGGADSAKSELVGELGGDDAGAKYSAGDTGALYHWTGSQWDLMPAERQSIKTNELSDRYVTVGPDGKYQSLATAVANEPRGQHIQITDDITITENVYPKDSQQIIGRGPNAANADAAVKITIDGDYAFVHDQDDTAANGDNGDHVKYKALHVDGVDQTPTRAFNLGQQATQVLFEHVWVYQCQRAFEYDGSFFINHQDSHVRNCDYGDYIVKTDGISTTQVNVGQGSTRGECDTAGAYLGNCSDIRFTEASFTPGNSKHIIVDGGSGKASGISIKGCHFENSDNYALDLRTTQSIKVDADFRKCGQTDGVSAIALNPPNSETAEDIHLERVFEVSSGDLAMEFVGNGTVRDIIRGATSLSSGIGSGVNTKTEVRYNQSSGRIDELREWEFRDSVDFRDAVYGNGGHITNFQRLDLNARDLSALSLTASTTGTIYRHDGSNQIDADGGTTSDKGYYVWDNPAGEFKSIVQF